MILDLPEVLGPPPPQKKKKWAGLKGVKYKIAILVFLHEIDPVLKLNCKNILLYAIS